MKLTRLQVYLLILVWAAASTFAMAQELWFASVIIGAISVVLGIVITWFDAAGTGWSPRQLRITGILVLIGGVVLAAFGVIDRFVIG